MLWLAVHRSKFPLTLRTRLETARLDLKEAMVLLC